MTVQACYYCLGNTPGLEAAQLAVGISLIHDLHYLLDVMVADGADGRQVGLYARPHLLTNDMYDELFACMTFLEHLR